MSHANKRTHTAFEDSIKSILAEIKTTQEKLALLQGDRREQRAYESYLMSCANALDMLRGQYELGMEAGKKEVARKMRQEGIASAMITEITGLTEAEVAAL